MNLEFNKQLKQILFILLLIALVWLVINELYLFFPGLLGAITFYILSRNSYFQLVWKYKWKKGWAAGMYLLIYFSLLISLTFVTINLAEKQIRPILNNPQKIFNDLSTLISQVNTRLGYTILSDTAIDQLIQRMTAFFPALINDTMNLILNLVILLFVLYYMLVHSKTMEVYFRTMIPLKETNVHLLSKETKKIVKTSALGIPIISVIQGVTATVGYYLFNVPEYSLLGFLTGVLAFFPVIGTMIIWVPVVLVTYLTGHHAEGIGLGLYSAIITGNIDYLARITLLKKWGHIHPIVTVLGVIVGLRLFGFLGLIFGPLLVNYIILLFRIYLNEFKE